MFGNHLTPEIVIDALNELYPNYNTTFALRFFEEKGVFFESAEEIKSYASMMGIVTEYRVQKLVIDNTQFVKKLCEHLNGHLYLNKKAI